MEGFTPFIEMTAAKGNENLKSKLKCRGDNLGEGKRKAKHFTICLLLQLALSLQIQILYVQSAGKSCLPFLIHASQVCIPE